MCERRVGCCTVAPLFSILLFSPLWQFPSIFIFHPPSLHPYIFTSHSLFFSLYQLLSPDLSCSVAPLPTFLSARYLAVRRRLFNESDCCVQSLIVIIHFFRREQRVTDESTHRCLFSGSSSGKPPLRMSCRLGAYFKAGSCWRATYAHVTFSALCVLKGGCCIRVWASRVECDHGLNVKSSTVSCSQTQFRQNHILYPTFLCKSFILNWWSILNQKEVMGKGDCDYNSRFFRC